MAEQRRRESEAWQGEMFRLLAENVLDYAVFIVDADRRILSWGKGAERLLGFSEQEIVGRQCDVFFTPEDVRRGVPQTELDEALATGRGDDDRWHVRKDGSRFWSSGTVTPLRDSGGALRGFAKIMRDRTELKRSQEALDDALAYAEAIVATVREPLAVLDGDLRVRTANRSFYATFRVRPEDTQGQLLYDLGNRQWDIPALRKLLGEILPRDAAFDDFEVEHDFPAIGRKVMVLNARKLFRKGNHTELILLAVEDVTALREEQRARREAESRFTEMVKNVRDHSIFLTDPDGVITSWNVAAERIIGYSEAETLGKHFSLIFTPEDVEAGTPEQELRQAREEGRAEDERWHQRKDGTRFWAFGIVTPLHDPQGRLSGFSKVLRDMTEWKEADQALRERQRQLEFVTDHAPVLLAQVDAGRRFKFVNVPYAERLGLHPRDLVGRPVRDVIGQEAYARIEPHVEAALRGERVEYEADVPYAGIGTQTMRVAYEPERDEGGRVVGYVAAILNISDRRRAEEQLAASRQRLQALFDNTLDAILLADDQARYVEANPAASALLGYDREELLRRGVFDVTPTPNGEAGRAAWAAFVREGRQSGEYALRRRDGSTAVVEYRAVANVQPGLHLSVLRDVTQRRRTEEALRESRGRLVEAQRIAGMGSWEIDWATRAVRWSDEMYRLFGVTADQFQPSIENFLAAVPAEDQPAIWRSVEEAIAGKAPYRVDHRVVRADGAVRVVSEQAEFTFGPDGEPTRLAGTMLDITERRAATETLRESEQRLRTLSDNLPLGAVYQVLADPEGGRRFLYISAGVERLFGVTPAEAAADATSLYGLVHEEDRARVAAQEEAALRDSAPFDCEFRSRTRSGGVIWVHARSAPRPLPTGQVVWEGIIMDTTARKVAENERAKFAFLVENATDFIGMCDLEYRPFYVNRAGLRMVGLESLKQARRTPVPEFFFPEDRAFVSGELIPRVLRDGHGEAELRFRHFRTGEAVWVVYAVVTLRDENGRPTGLATVSRNITERKRAEEALRLADRRKDEFLAMLAHELRNPLAPIRNAAQVIRLVGTADPNVQRATELVERQVQHMTRLVDDLLDVSRITSGKIKLQKEPVELAAVVGRAVETARPLIEARRHELAVTLPREAVPLEADPTRLAQVIANLLTNAAKYTEEGGHVRLTVEREGGTAVVRVRDDGVGIPSEMLSSVFTLFTQVDRTLARSEGGLGIGLTLVKSLTELHGGTVEARSEGPGTGSEFIVRLPVARTPQAPDAGPADPAGAGRPPPRRVLVVDDNVDAAESLAMLLRVGRHDVRTAHDGATALQLAGAFRPEVVLLDIGLPRMDGYQVARRLREQEGMGGAVLVALTGYGQDEDRRRSQEAGFDRHLVKPADPTALNDILASFEPSARRGARP
jgi:PAS domain S-box-containing protein